MSDSNKKKAVEVPRNILLKKLPLIISKDKLALFKADNGVNKDLFVNNVKAKRVYPLYKEDVIYKSSSDDFALGESHKVTLLNKLNVITNTSRTVAKYVSQYKECIEKTSDNVTKLIGQKNYDIVFSALCSVINQDLKVRGILALLTSPKSHSSVSCETDESRSGTCDNFKNVKKFKETSSQTDETYIYQYQCNKQRKRVRQHLTPYVVKDPKPNRDRTLKKVVIKPESLYKKRDVTLESTERVTNDDQIIDSKKQQSVDSKKEQSVDSKKEGNKNITNENNFINEKVDVKIEDKKESSTEKQFLLPDIKDIVDEDSNISDISFGNMSTLSSLSIPELLEGQTKLLFNNIDRRTEDDNKNDTLTMLNKSDVMLPVKPEDMFHIATPEILKCVRDDTKRKLLWQQAYIDWKYCLLRDEDNNLPIHHAVLTNDVDLLRRQCIVLKSRQESVDIAADGNLSALQMCILQGTSAECTATLLQHGADPLQADEEQRTALHLAAEAAPAHLRAILDHCSKNARQVLQDSEDLWNQSLEDKSDQELARHLLDKMCSLCDNQGYTALMLASKLGNCDNVQALVEAAPATVNHQMPTSGNTALYLAIGAACLDAVDRGNKSKMAENFMRTIEILVENGADPAIDNHSGANVNVLLTEFNVGELSMLIANKLTYVKYGETATGSNAGNSIILVRDNEGRVNIEKVNAVKKEKDSSKAVKKDPKAIKKDKPSVLNSSKGDKRIETNDTSPTRVICVNKNLKRLGPEPVVIQKVIGQPSNIVIKSETKTIANSPNKGWVKVNSVITIPPSKTTSVIVPTSGNCSAATSKRKNSGPLDLSPNSNKIKKFTIDNTETK